jgi:hypothetical protein
MADSRQSRPFGYFADRPALRASRCVFHFQSLEDLERQSKLRPQQPQHRQPRLRPEKSPDVRHAGAALPLPCARRHRPPPRHRGAACPGPRRPVCHRHRAGHPRRQHIHVDILPTGHALLANDQNLSYVNQVGKDFFTTYRIPILSGRTFNSADARYSNLPEDPPPTFYALYTQSPEEQLFLYL